MGKGKEMSFSTKPPLPTKEPQSWLCEACQEQVSLAEDGYMCSGDCERVVCRDCFIPAEQKCAECAGVETTKQKIARLERMVEKLSAGL